MSIPLPFPIEDVHRTIDTPALLVSERRLEKNVKHMQELAGQHRVRLRPHVKTHKSEYIARLQLSAGAAGLTSAKLSEADVFLQAGMQDIFIANQITHPLKLKKLRELHDRNRLILGIDHKDQLLQLEPFFSGTGKPLEVRIEIDSGLQRCGVTTGPGLTGLAREINEKPWLKLEGIFTHAGQVYGARNSGEIRRIGITEKTVMEEAFSLLDSRGLTVQTVSVGSTPTAAISSDSEIVNEMRPGNYVFYDGIQLSLGVCSQEDCALFVLATVTSIPSPERVVIDAGSKALNLDRGAQSHILMEGFGTLVNTNGILSRLSEEHGIIETGHAGNMKTGQPVLIIPNHACAVVNLYEEYHLVSPEGVRQLPVSARAMSR